MRSGTADSYLPGNLRGALLVAVTGVLFPLLSLAGETASCIGAQSRLAATAQALSQGELAQAQRIVEEMQRRFPECSEVLLGLGRLREAHGDVYAAQSLFSRYILREPKKSKGYCSLARILFSQGEYERASALAEQALLCDPKDLEALAMRGRTLAATGETGKAQEFLEKACNLAPKDAEAHYQLGRLYRQTERPKEAAREFASVILLNPQNPRAYANLGLSFEELGENEKAEEAYKKGLQVNQGLLSEPSLDLIYGRLLLKQNRFQESQTHLDRATQKQPESRVVYYERAKLDLQLRNYLQARNDAEHALTLPDSTGDVLDNQLFYLLVTIYERLGDTEHAREYSDLCRALSAPRIIPSTIPKDAR